MRFIGPALLCLLTAGAASFAQAPTSRPARPIGADEGPFAYSFDRETPRGSDILTLRDGRQRVGKVMEWATQVLHFDGAGRISAYPVEDVLEFRLRRWPRNTEKPDLPDLTVAYVERLPRDLHWHGAVRVEGGLPRATIELPAADAHPRVGSPVKFRIHVLNAGSKASAACRCEVSVDAAKIHAADLPAIQPGAEHVIETEWPWEAGPRLLTVRIDPEARQREVQRWNNTFQERIDAQALTFVVARSRRDAFRDVRNLVDSFCIEDWIQYHVRMVNALAAASVYPSAPQGILERVRCDRIVVVDDPGDPDARAGWEASLHRGGKRDAPSEYAGLLTLGRPSQAEDLRTSALYVDWSIPRRIGADLGLVDLAATDTEISQCRVRDLHEQYVVRQHLFPWARTMMYAAGPYPFSEACAGHLNRTRGAPRGFSGTFLYQVPRSIVVEARASDGSPLPGVQVDVFQLMADGEDAGSICGLGRTDPIASLVTNERGRARLPDQQAPTHKCADGYELRPNPFGRIDAKGRNGLLLLRVRRGPSEEFHFLRLFDCLVAANRGQSEEYLHPIQTRLGPVGAPPPPPFTAVRISVEPSMPGGVSSKIGWRFPENVDEKELEGFHVYQRTGLAGDESGGWTLVEALTRASHGWPTECAVDCDAAVRFDTRDARDVAFAVCTVDKTGREGDLSPATAYFAWQRECASFAMDSDIQAYISLGGEGVVQMAQFNPYVGIQPYQVQCRAFPGYSPVLAGLAVARDRRLFAADPVNHVIAVFDRGDLQEVYPRRNEWPGLPGRGDGEFHTPADVAVDSMGNVFVADTGNDRVQMLDSSGRFKTHVDADFGFVGPTGLAWSADTLTVVDKDRERVRVYDASGAAPVFLRELPPVKSVDRALTDRTGRTYLPGRDPETGQWAILVYAPDGKSARFERAITRAEGQGGEVIDPRGLCFVPTRGGESAYFVNGNPFTIRSIRLPDSPATPPQ